MTKVQVVYGVDFSGAKLAGRTTWVAEVKPRRRGQRAQLLKLDTLEKLAGAAERAPALAHLVGRIRASHAALWALNFPFGLPVEVLPPRCGWAGQYALLKAWGEDAYGLGVDCFQRALAMGLPGHVRRRTDAANRTPFDAYHYRIIYQTFYGMRDVLGPLRRDPFTAVLPFHAKRLARARRAVVESCPASTLRRLGLPTFNYKQPAGGPLVRKRRTARRAILDGLAWRVELTPGQRLRLMRDPGGDAIDAVVSAVGALDHWRTTDPAAVARQPRHAREGYHYV